MIWLLALALLLSMAVVALGYVADRNASRAGLSRAQGRFLLVALTLSAFGTVALAVYVGLMRGWPWVWGVLLISAGYHTALALMAFPQLRSLLPMNRRP